MTTFIAAVPATSPVRRGAYRSLLRSELRLFLRSGGSVFWTALIPVVALVIIGNIPAVSRPAKELHGISYLTAYLPILMAFAICMATINLLPPTLAVYRERGVLRRLTTTPVGPYRMLAAQVSIYAGLASVVSVVLLVVAVSAFDVPLPHQLPGYVLSLLLLGAATTAVGVLIASLARTGKAANAMSAAAFFPLMFFAGLWVPRAQMPSLLRHVSDFSPLGAGVRALQDCIAGQFPPASPLLVLVGWAAVCGFAAARSFRWE